MKRIITFLLIVFSITASAQNAYWFANYRPTDTAKTPCWLKFAGGAVMPYYATGDTTIFAGWDINGNLVGRKMVMVANTNQNIDSTLAHGNTAVGKRMIMLSRTQSGSYTWETIVDTNIIATGYYQSGTFMPRSGLYSLGGSNTGYGVLELDTLLNYRSRIHPPKAQTGTVDLYMSNVGGTMARAEDSTTFIETIAAANTAQAQDIKYADTGVKVATPAGVNTATASSVKNGGNSFGAGMSVGTNDSNSVTVKANGKNWSIMNARGRWVFNSSSSNADTAAGATAAVKITDTVSQTGTSTHSGIIYYMTNTGTLAPNLLTLYYNNTQMLAVGSNGGINAFGGWNSTGGIATSSTLSGAALSVSRNSATAGVAAIINQQQANTGALLELKQGGALEDSITNGGGWRQTGSDFSSFLGNVLVGTGTDNGTDKLQVAGNINLTTAGNKIKIATGSNATLNTATLTAGTVTVSNTSVTANSVIFVTAQNCMSCASYSIGTKTAGTSFVINSTNISDGSTVAYFIIN